MSKFTVSAAEMQTAINELKAANGEFKSRVSELETAQQELSAMYQGDSSTAFNAAFQSDKSQWSTFAALIDQYVETMGAILTTYNTAEATNTDTAKTRTYGG